MTLQFTSFADLMAMGHHGAFVWSAWGITLLGIVGLILQTKRARTQWIQQAYAQQRRRASQSTQSSSEQADGTPQ